MQYVSVTASREGDAPYIQAELRDIFRLFFKQVSNNLPGVRYSWAMDQSKYV
ncbi:hypothetical protein C8J55DRAFT_530807 [Lentinula edodes]|uniref:Uncharacterized protein n=1 Tax=Lentinula lateritia TaxID=40482 RepID=A0A9W9DDK7_9AGAR|nr:hypothetical protein C8J55DRAFT_530807 [Lentinula edodes]